MSYVVLQDSEVGISFKTTPVSSMFPVVGAVLQFNVYKGVDFYVYEF